jgi:hypothetical protein
VPIARLAAARAALLNVPAKSGIRTTAKGKKAARKHPGKKPVRRR